jgi:hypothetical protein
METPLNVVRYTGWVLLANGWHKGDYNTGGPTLFEKVLAVLDRDDPEAAKALREGRKPKID